MDSIRPSTKKPNDCCFRDMSGIKPPTPLFYLAHGFKLLLTLCISIICSTAFSQEKLNYTVVVELLHDDQSFTQGLYYENQLLYESSGLYGRSFVQVYDAEKNTVLQKRALPSTIFAEGLTVLDSQIFLLSWRAGKVFILNKDTLQLENQWRYDGEGWGLTHTKDAFIMSDGSSNLYFRSKKDFSITKKIDVRNRWRAYKNLNELEYAKGFIYANVWQSPYILQISPDDGTVVAIANLSRLVQANSRAQNQTVLNGIAYDEAKDAFWITGKMWKKRYLLKFNKVSNVGKPEEQ